MSSEERDLDELLGAYALDAVSDEERRAIEQYLAVNPKARAEVEEHREVATMLAWSGADAPEGLWERIAGSLDGTAPAPTGELAEVLSYDTARDRRRARRSSFGRWAIGAAAAAVVVVLAAGVVTNDDGGSDGLAAAADAARQDADSSITTIVAPDGDGSVEAIIDPNGHGFLLANELPELPADRSYQLWGLIDDEVISLGVLGQNPELATFSVEGPVTVLMITNEVAGGVATDGNPDGAWVGTF